MHGISTSTGWPSLPQWSCHLPGASLLLIPLSPKGAFSHAQKFLLVHNPELLLMAVTCDGLAASPLPPMPLTPQLTCLFGITSVTPSHQLIIDNKRSESMDDVC